MKAGFNAAVVVPLALILAAAATAKPTPTDDTLPADLELQRHGSPLAQLANRPWQFALRGRADYGGAMDYNEDAGDLEGLFVAMEEPDRGQVLGMSNLQRHRGRSLGGLGGGQLVRSLGGLGGGQLVRSLGGLGGGQLIRRGLGGLGGGQLLRSFNAED
ncbi:uncharacterized protein LOC132197834 isoform X2 [Neocloeon triangulifer]|uniref:uncharacterized protein LOC132197834 isoform X2 n=1 Tax=Neocloeon triangulifer TaxID=2078957 RepID=UPI00286F043F|nr:uncharacterized protein LOC132197834 isoform X2 [Neocloeon triangulifer]